VEDEDQYATVKRPKGSGSRNEIKKRHLIGALGISQKEWADIVVSVTILPALHNAHGTRRMLGSFFPSQDWRPYQGARRFLGRRRVSRREGELWLF
jgi:hypothetical protein